MEVAKNKKGILYNKGDFTDDSQKIEIKAL